ncbi:MAG: DUF169 domain-containing protein [Methanomassiliicoccus sp.]|nr:DUF169 domain-containing protein [Methanomassiliicoccus sp.]
MIMSVRDIGEKLTTAGKLAGRAVCVIGGEDPFPGAVHLGKVDRCVARAIFDLAMDADAPPMTYGADQKGGICPGGQLWCGISGPSPKLKYLISTGTPEFMGGAAEHLKPSPEAAERFFASPGRITPPGRYISLAGYDQVDDDAGVLSFILIGTAESVRNLGGLVQFVSDDIFTSVLMPGGASCASMITYAAGLAERAPRNAAFVGPVDPTGNAWLPPDLMTMAVPLALARSMAENVDASFLSKRAEVAFPARRLSLGEKME